ncbi:hypothetical protein ACN38_g433 [Penicillium nordicum]|uniref:Uncharacterized protein n=1 Tax=Penicillium nordicum TaxID=229535 RepID=A0A0M8PIY7_9EURO|nr:hypothetical protein ACN38_g433 [Penicillium nordicum]
MSAGPSGVARAPVWLSTGPVESSPGLLSTGARAGSATGFVSALAGGSLAPPRRCGTTTIKVKGLFQALGHKVHVLLPADFFSTLSPKTEESLAGGSLAIKYASQHITVSLVYIASSNLDPLSLFKD